MTLLGIRKISVVITETSNGWVLTWDGLVQNCYISAAHAQQAVRDRGAELAMLGVPVLYDIEWRVLSDLGKRVVKSLCFEN